MAVKQFTECIEPSEFDKTDHILLATIQAAMFSAAAFGVAAAKSRLSCWPLLLEVSGIAWLVAYCRLFLFHRLLCLVGDQEAIGVVVRVVGTTLTGLPDNDFSVNLLLQDNQFGAQRDQVVASKPFGFLVATNPKVTAAGIDTVGVADTDQATGLRSEVLHCEFEGGGVFGLLAGASVALAAATAAALLCIYLPPIPGLQTIITVLALLALLALLLGGLIGLGTSGDASDVNANIGEVQVNNDPNNGLGAGADILYIRGRWVFDPWHEGWNEIHPVKVCTRIGRWKGDWIDVPPNIILRVRTHFDEAAADTTQAAQKRRENQWVVHPSLDGCAADIIT
jgi:hypothetical protein